MREIILISLIPVLVSGAGLNVIGNDYVSTGEIITAAGSTTEPDIAAVERLYDSYGFLDVEIEFQPEAGALAVTEGPMYRLAAVSVAGEMPYTANEVKDKLALDRGDPISILALERGIESILEDLRDEGYLEAEVEYSIDKKPAGTTDVNVEFSAGEKYAVGEIEFFGVGAFVEDELRRRMETREGTRFSEANLGADILNIIDLYRENGYPEARAVPSRFVLLKDLKALDFSILVDEGRRVTVGEVSVAGNRRTREKVVRRELTFGTGQPYDVTEIRKSRRRLYSLKYFKEPPEIELTDPANGVIKVSVAERRTYDVSGALGYEPATEYTSANLLGYLSASIHNFLGTGRDIDAAFSKPGEDDLDALAAYREPWIGGVDLFARPECAYRKRTTYRRVDGELTFGTRPLTGLTVAAGGGFARVWKTDPSRTVKAIGRAEYDSRDYFPNPRTGWEIALDSEARFKEYFNDGLRDVIPALELNAWRYFPVTRNTVLAARGKTAGVFASRFSDDEYMYLGGPANLRGFRNEQFPVSYYALGTVEYRFLVGRDGRLFFFTDGAYRKRKAADGTDSGFELGYGAGLRAPTALGIYGVDFAVAAGEHPLDGKIHVTVTQEF